MKKKTNPRNIPVDKRSINLDAIVDEAMKDDMQHAWLLVGSALVGQKKCSAAEVKELRESMKEFDATERNIRYAERLMGTKKRPSVDMNNLYTAADLKKLKANMEKLALHTALCSICLGLEEKGFKQEELKKLFLDLDITKREIEGGTESYENLERRMEIV